MLLMQRIRNRFFFILALLLLAGNLHAQFWLQQAGGPTSDLARDIAVDPAGNTYTVGQFSTGANFGATMLTASGLTDIFVTKTDDQGNYLWAIGLGGTGSDEARAVEVDAAGNAYVTARFNGTVTFGTQTFTSAGGFDGVIFKVNTNGVVQWAVHLSSVNFLGTTDISYDDATHLAVCGSFSGAADIGGIPLNTTGATDEDAFVCRLDTAGNMNWAVAGAGNAQSASSEVSYGTDNALYLSGIFSDTITFNGSVHNNTLGNVGFLVQFDSSGTEQWFNGVGATTSSAVQAMEADANRVWLSGSAQGTLFRFDDLSLTNIQTLTGAFNMVTLRFLDDGSFEGSSAIPAEGIIGPRELVIDSAGDAYLCGLFECSISGMAAQYGTGTFISRGVQDGFVAKMDPVTGVEHMQQLAGDLTIAPQGIAVSAGGTAYVCGFFSDSLYVPVSGNFLPANLANYTAHSCVGNNGYCGDPDYGEFIAAGTSGFSDIFLGPCIDPNREPYDFFMRSGTTCDRDLGTVCVDTTCTDSIFSCSPISVFSQVDVCPNISPTFSFTYSTDTGSASQPFNTSETYFVEATIGGTSCVQIIDSVEIVISGQPQIPLISDDIPLNDSALVVQTIELCGMDTITLAGAQFGNDSAFWVGPGLGIGVNADTVMVDQEGEFQYFVVDTNGCSNFNRIFIEFYDSLPDVNLILNAPDTVRLCAGDSFRIQIYDSISNPLALDLCLPTNDLSLNTDWTISPFMLTLEECQTFNSLVPLFVGSQLVSVTATVERSNPCDTQTVVLTTDIFVILDTVPIIQAPSLTITGSDFFCPGDSTWLVASGSDNFSWFGPGVIGDTTDSIFAGTATLYQVSTTITDTNGSCVNSVTATANKILTEKPEPTITASAQFACPNDSVLLICTAVDTINSSYQWIGPSGVIPGDSSHIFVTEPGDYQCLVNDPDSCNLLSNIVTINPNTVAGLVVAGNLTLCPGESVTLTVTANLDAVVEWLPPLSGNDLSQTVTTAGSYTVRITSCGEVNEVTVDVASSNVFAAISGDSLLCSGGTARMVANPGFDLYTWLPFGFVGEEVFASDTGLYTLSVTDSLGCTATSAPFRISPDPDIVPTPTITDASGCFNTSATLTATADSGIIQWFEVGETTPILTGNSFSIDTLDELQTYEVNVLAGLCPSERVLATATPIACNELDIPNVFSPNADGNNDEFLIGLNGNGCFTCTIWSRWGNEIFVIDREGMAWDGTIAGTGLQASPGVYFYVAEYCQQDGEMTRMTGSVTVIR